ncbi:MAG TPA: RsmB/NOP family class I SAM-dependent RNA methyltransferase [Candidatus Bathyarchaeia archaeon]|nr:RsmB/NOP family class I SAM-dependent RNA methyltransferase [Candidatus Bathyarchaeia archaeon]
MDSVTNLIEITHNESLKIILQYEQSSQTVRYFLRKHLIDYFFSDEIAAKIQAVVVGIVRYQNTINFILNRTVPKNILQQLSIADIASIKVAIFELRWQKIPIQDIAPLVKIDVKYLTIALNLNLNANVKTLNQENQISIIYSHPTFLVHTLIEKLGKPEAVSLMEKNNTQAIAYLRVNQLLQDSESILNSIITKGVILEQDKDLPFLYIIKEGLQTVVKTDAFKKGQIFIQDKASVTAVKALNPNPGDFIWDACAAPGMKTHLLWELMKRQGQLVASDINDKRLQEAQQRFLSYNCKGIEWMQADASITFIPKIKKILIDAPCTSTGIIQSHPSYKWRLNKNWLFSIMTIQNKILDGIISNYSNQPGTEILYSTCSILPHEGENQIDSVLERFDNLELLDGPTIGQKGYLNFKCTNKVRRLFPHIHNTNGFFIAHMKII